MKFLVIASAVLISALAALASTPVVVVAALLLAALAVFAVLFWRHNHRAKKEAAQIWDPPPKAYPRPAHTRSEARAEQQAERAALRIDHLAYVERQRAAKDAERARRHEQLRVSVPRVEPEQRQVVLLGNRLPAPEQPEPLRVATREDWEGMFGPGTGDGLDELKAAFPPVQLHAVKLDEDTKPYTVDDFIVPPVNNDAPCEEQVPESPSMEGVGGEFSGGGASGEWP